MYEIRDEHGDTEFEGTLTECAEYILSTYDDDARISMVDVDVYDER